MLALSDGVNNVGAAGRVHDVGVGVGPGPPQFLDHQAQSAPPLLHLPQAVPEQVLVQLFGDANSLHVPHPGGGVGVGVGVGVGPSMLHGALLWEQPQKPPTGLQVSFEEQKFTDLHCPS